MTAKKQPPQPDKYNVDDLRRRAEVYLTSHAAGSGDGALIDDMQVLLHELDVHRVEMEMQNEELRRTQEELEAAHLAYTDLYDFAPVGYLTINAAGKISAANLTAAGLLGVVRERLLQQPLSNFVVSEERDTLFLHRKAVLGKGAQQVCTLRMQDAQGVPFHARLVSAAALDVDGQGDPDAWRTVFNDISKLVKAETALTASQKLAGLGTLSAGIAHEINSPLQVITGLSERFLRLLPKNDMTPEKLLEDAGTINRNAWRIAGIVRSLLSYARANQEEYLPEDLSEIVENTLALIEYQLSRRDNVTILKELDPALPLCTCSSGGVSQVLINLLTNAADAMQPSGGQITLRTAYLPEERRFMLQVCDNGVGIPTAVLKHIFDPFWTTKEVGKGSGLGLSVSQGIIEAHGGQITVESTPGKGSTFSVWLPQDAPAGQPADKDKVGRY